MSRPKKAGKTRFTRLREDDENAFAVIPGNDSKKIRDLVHEALMQRNKDG